MGRSGFLARGDGEGREVPLRVDRDDRDARPHRLLEDRLAQDGLPGPRGTENHDVAEEVLFGQPNRLSRVRIPP